MIGENGIEGHTGAELAQHRLDRDARAADHRLTAHNLRIDFDSLVGHGRLFSLFRTLTQIGVCFESVGWLQFRSVCHSGTARERRTRNPDAYSASGSGFRG